MGNRAEHQNDLNGLFDAYLQNGNQDALTEYLLGNSNLPGRRGNIELAAAFGDSIEARQRGHFGRLWEYCSRLVNFSINEAPVNTAMEFLPFCGTVGVGTIGSVVTDYYDQAMLELERLANDPRWRTREAVCFGLLRLLTRRATDTLQVLQAWAKRGSLLERRAAAAGVAEPQLLKNEPFAVDSLRIHEIIFQRFPETEDRRGEDFRVLRKGLAFTLSVVVSAIPEIGFDFMGQLTADNDPDIDWILKQNLKKNRLLRYFPKEVAEIQQLLV